uniref:LEM domain-containing protein 2 n=1 Tax=Pseudonaja textilis TaxID=8673 RepID=A0A670ZYC9_PSETE
MAAAELSDAKLRAELFALGYQPGPITDSTRKLYAKKLTRLRAEVAAGQRSRTSSRATPFTPERIHLPAREVDPLSSPWRPSAGFASKRTQLEADEAFTSPYQRETVVGRSASSTPWRPTPSNEEGGVSSRKWWEKEPRTSRSTKTVLGTRPERDLNVGTRWDGTQRYVGQKHQAPSPGKKGQSLEFYLSWFLWVATLVLLVIFLGILWVKMMGPAHQEGSMENCTCKPFTVLFLLFQYCREKQEEITTTILYELYNYLAIQAGNFECGNPENLESKCIPFSEAKDYIENVTGYSIKKFEDALQWLLDKTSMVLQGKEPSEPVTTVKQVVCLESAHPRMGLGCRFHRALYTAVTNLFIFFWSLAFLWGILILLKYYWRKREEQDEAMYEMVQKIIAAVQNHYKEWEQNLERYPYVGILHIRDTLIPPQERRKMKHIWDRAKGFLASNESRIQTELHRVAGEDMLVWRWTQPSYLSDSDH